MRDGNLGRKGMKEEEEKRRSKGQASGEGEKRREEGRVRKS